MTLISSHRMTLRYLEQIRGYTRSKASDTLIAVNIFLRHKKNITATLIAIVCLCGVYPVVRPSATLPAGGRGSDHVCVWGVSFADTHFWVGRKFLGEFFHL